MKQNLLLALLTAASGPAFALSYPVRCATAAACPPWVAGLRHQTSVCTAVQVKADLMATNRHCLPADLQHEGQDCTGRMIFSFPATASFPARVLECDRIMHVSPPLDVDEVGPDLAFVRLKEKSDRPSIDISREGFADGENVSIYRIDPDASNTGVLSQLSCQATQNTILNPYFSSNKAPTVTFAKCPVNKGNSGSPVVDLSGRLRGVLNARSEIPFDGLSFARQQTGQLASGHGTNLACLAKDVLDSQTPPESCYLKTNKESRVRLSQELIDRKVQEAVESLRLKVNSTSEKLFSMDRAFFAWKPSREEDAEQKKKDRSYILSIAFRPLCLVPKVTDISQLKDRLKSSPVKFTIKTPLYTLHQGVDEQLRFRVEIHESEMAEQVRLTPKDLLLGKKIGVDFLSEDGLMKEAKQFDLCNQPAAY